MDTFWYHVVLPEYWEPALASERALIGWIPTRQVHTQLPAFGTPEAICALTARRLPVLR